MCRSFVYCVGTLSNVWELYQGENVKGTLQNVCVFSEGGYIRTILMTNKTTKNELFISVKIKNKNHCKYSPRTREHCAKLKNEQRRRMPGTQNNQATPEGNKSRRSNFRALKSPWKKTTSGYARRAIFELQIICSKRNNAASTCVLHGQGGSLHLSESEACGNIGSLWTGSTFTAPTRLPI